MLSLVRIAPYAVMLILGSALVVSREERARKALTTVFVAFVAGAQIVAGLAQRDLWPFSPFPVIAESASRVEEAVWYDVRAVGRDGSEARLDASPLTDSVLTKWFERALPRLTAAQRDNASRFLLARTSRYPNGMILRAAAAPDWLLHRGRVQQDGAAALRVYRCDVRSRTPVYEFRPR